MLSKIGVLLTECVKKCKIMMLRNGHNLNPQLMIQLQGQMLEQVSSYKYLGINLNIELTFDNQWRIIQTKTRSLPYLLKKLKHIGFNKTILKNVFRSLGLSHFTYSAPILASISKSSKTEITSFQHRILRIIGIPVAEFEDINDIIDENNRILITRILAEPGHPLTRKLQLTRSARSCNSGFKPYFAKSSAYSNSFLQKYLRALNNNGISDQYTNGKKSKDSNYKKITLKLAKSKFTRSKIKTNHLTTFKTKPDKPRILCNICGKSYIGNT